MKRAIFRHMLLAALLLSALFSALASADELAAKLKAHMAELAKKEGVSGAVLVTKDGQPLLREAYGKANYELDAPNTPETKFRLGSITKQFTAMAVMILAEQGKLAVSDPISKHLENPPATWDKITIRHLLTHASGIPSYTNFPQMMTRTVRLPATVDEVIATFRDKPLEFEPGERFAYSNSGYIVLGKLIERASGLSYEAFLRQQIFDPLEMSDSGYDHSGTLLSNRAAGYQRTLFVIGNAPYIDMSWPYAAGSLYSTVDDLAKWDRALVAGKLISAESYQAMFTPYLRSYAYGWFVREHKGHKEIGHGGGIHGFTTAILRYPDDKLCVIVLNNIPTQSERFAHELADIALARAPAAAEAK